MPAWWKRKPWLLCSWLGANSNTTYQADVIGIDRAPVPPSMSCVFCNFIAARCTPLRLQHSSHPENNAVWAKWRAGLPEAGTESWYPASFVGWHVRLWIAKKTWRGEQDCDTHSGIACCLKVTDLIGLNWADWPNRLWSSWSLGFVMSGRLTAVMRL